MTNELSPETANEHLESADADARKHAIAKALVDLQLEPVSPSSIEAIRKDAIKLPLSQITSLGIGLSEIPEAFRTASATINPQAGMQLFQAVLPQGASLKQAKDGLFSSSAALADGTPAWAKFSAVSPSTQVTAMTTTVPIDPTALVAAAALAQVNQKLDGIQDTLDEMFDYLRIKDKASLLSSLETLQSILADYRYNLDNKQFKQESLGRAHSVNENACQHILELKAHLEDKVRKKKLVELRGQAQDATETALDMLKDYQLAVHLYAFSTFLEIVFFENYDQAYLEKKADDIRQKSLEYRETYTACFNTLETRTEKTVDKAVVDGIATGMQKLGRLLEKTPVGNVASIDESLAKAGSEIRAANQRKSCEITELLIEAKDPAVAPFTQSIDAISRVYNQPAQIYIDEQSVYLLPS